VGCHLGWDTEQDSFGKAIVHHPESQNWVLACSRLSRSVFSDTVTLQMLRSVKEFISLKCYVKESPLKVIWCNRMVLLPKKDLTLTFVFALDVKGDGGHTL